MTDKELYSSLLIINGRFNQLLKSVEEASEFCSAMAKYLCEGKGIDNVIEEIADVQIMLEQVRFIMGISDEVETMKRMKINRQIERIQGKEKGKFPDVGFDVAIIGKADGKYIYSYERMVEVLMKRDAMTQEEAEEFVTYNCVNTLSFMDNPPLVAFGSVEGMNHE